MTTHKQTKTEKVQAMLRRPAGASLGAICEATDWQAHSARAALSSLRKKGCKIERRVAGDGKPATYHMLAGAENKA